MKQTNITAIIVAIIVVIGVLLAVWLLVGRMPATTTGNTISATGNAQMTVMPDEAVVYVMVETHELTAEKAKDENSRISDAVNTALLNVNIAKSDIQTQNFNIYPEYDWSNGTQTLKGYVASNQLVVKTKDFSNVGKIVDAAVDKGGLVNSINFDLTNDKTNEYKKTVLANASQDAKAKAEAIAAGLGKKLGKLVSVQASDYNYMPYPIYARSDMMASGAAEAKVAATNIQPHSLDVTATVSVSYAIG